MKKKFLLLIGLTTILCLFLCSCGEYRKVEEQISSLGNITIESRGALEKIAVAYSNLSDDEKQKVSNYRDYQDSLAEFNVENMIDSLGQVTLDSGALLEEIATAYSKLSSSRKECIDNYSDYQKALDDYDTLVYENIDTIYDEIAFTDYGNHEEILIGLNRYEKYFTEGQKKGLLAIYYFYEDIPQYVENYVVSRLKSPRSYYLYSMEVDCFVIGSDEKDKQMGTVDIVYGATNSFGGEVTDSLSFLIDFKLNSNRNGIVVTGNIVM